MRVVLSTSQKDHKIRAYNIRLTAPPTIDIRGHHGGRILTTNKLYNYWGGEEHMICNVKTCHVKINIIKFLEPFLDLSYENIATIPPPQHRTSLERDNGNIEFSNHNAQEISKNVKDKKDEKIGTSGKDETISLTEE
nr:replication protein A 70 kDa DNA-binding subunit C [Tanacetum cinerariifolium]